MLHAASDAGKLGNLLERLAAADETINTLTRQLDAIPAIDKSAIDDLAELEKNLERAELAVQMVATRIDISEAASEICIAERPFTAGEASIITEPTEITFAGGTRLLITPGGGTSLADARLAAAEAKQKLQAHLTELGVIDRPSAIQRLAAREQFSRQIAQHRQEVATLLDGESQTAARDREQASRQKLATAEQRVAAILERAESDQPEPALPADLAKVNDAMEPVDAEYDNLQQSVNDLSKRHENAVRSQEISADAVQETRRNSQPTARTSTNFRSNSRRLSRSMVILRPERMPCRLRHRPTRPRFSRSKPPSKNSTISTLSPSMPTSNATSERSAMRMRNSRPPRTPKPSRTHRCSISAARVFTSDGPPPPLHLKPPTASTPPPPPAPRRSRWCGIALGNSAASGRTRSQHHCG